MIGKPQAQLSILDSVFFKRKKRSRSKKIFKQINEIVNCNKLVHIIENAGIYKSGKRGRPSIPILYMLKVLFLQYLYNLSDLETEDVLIDRLSFRRFVGVGFDEDIPDFTTIWRFRERLSWKSLDKLLFKEVVRMLERKGFILRKGTLIDASIVQAARRPPRQDEGQLSSKRDYNAFSTGKGNKSYYGYKGHVGVDYGSGIIRRTELSAANVHDSALFNQLVSGDEQTIYADKAYDSSMRKRRLRRKGFYYGILDKGRRNHPWSNKQRRNNKQKSRVRNLVEHVFVQLKHHLGYRVVRYVNFIRNRLQFYFLCMIYNIRRGITLVHQS